MSHNLKTNDSINQDVFKVDNNDQRYLTMANGQVNRISSDGHFIPRIRMSKKERLKLRSAYSKIKNLDANDLANKIIETPVINPLKKDEKKDDARN